MAMRDIKAGEEITYDYALTQGHPEWILAPKCLCGSVRERGIGLSWFDFPPSAVFTCLYCVLDFGFACVAKTWFRYFEVLPKASLLSLFSINGLLLQIHFRAFYLHPCLSVLFLFRKTAAAWLRGMIGRSPSFF